ncbi:methylaspartate mutase subunit S [Colwellia sp. MSW7]|uniref:Methylaspartate mutase subunit S n=1 Tax=Colwellia maritima TaxID=2912588 RepID=A0ABS9X5N9_9GAMM|nr:methylaspartate mutase subunit S [Colwellia maritima]MCI2284756.1 methylaspartate mutase subunit S [Colwellia maritima]
MKVVTGVVGNDIHVVANRLIELSLNARGYEVFNLGVNTYLEEFFDAVVETGAEVLMISSLNGEAEGRSREVKALKSKYKNLDNLIMMIGGNLVVGTGNADDIVPRYKNYGFDIVCHQVDLNTGLDMLEDLLAERKSEGKSSEEKTIEDSVTQERNS